MDSNEDIKKTIDETAKRHTQLELLKKVRVYETKRMDIDAVKENTFRRKYEYDEDYGTESFNKEVQKQKNKLVEIKKRKFKNCLIKFAIATTIIAGTVGTASYVKGYKKGFNNGKKVTTESIEKEYLKKNDLSTAPNIIVDKWADESISKFDEYIQKYSEQNANLVDHFESIKSGVYSDLKRSYDDYLETGSEESYQSFRKSAEQLESSLNSCVNDDSYDFDKSIFSYAVLVDPEGNFVDKNIDDKNLQIYIAEKFNDGEVYDQDVIIRDGVVYQKYNSNEYSKQFNK